jgi:hypothetical protein
LAVVLAAGACAGGVAPAAEGPRLFAPPRRPPLPAVKDAAWPRNALDVFVLARLEANGLAPNRPAGRLRLLRRVTFDLTGLPPTAQERSAFLADGRPGAYARVVDRLLASPRFGERWAQHWLDLVRYAESDGFKEDAVRPDAHKYRDHVIRAVNANVGYDRFVRRQLAGDELEPGDPEAAVATGFNRLGPDESNAANLEQRRQEILDDVTDTAGLVFLGLTVGCARCHDHKYDPLSQKEYYRLQSFFAPMRPAAPPAVGPAGLRAFQQARAAWEAKTAGVRAEMEKLVAARRAQLREGLLTRFRAEIQQAVRTPPARRTPYQQQIAAMAEKQMDRAGQDAPLRLGAADKKRYQALARRLAGLGPPPVLPAAMAVADVGAEAPPTHRLIGGDWRKPAAAVRPGFPEALGATTPDTSLPAGVRSTGRRAALARWLTAAGNPLTARVMANRLWQHHFGSGIVQTASDMGAQGSPPSHPGLLDWLAVEFVESGWDLKHLHRLMVLSAAYRQDSAVDAAGGPHARALARDPGNTLLWRAARRRLGGEALRDSMLALSGELNLRMFGPSARPALPAGVSRYAWKPDADPADRSRRSVYVLARRNMRFPLFDAFDLPDMHNSCSRRLRTTTAPQALEMLNGELSLGQARLWGRQLQQRWKDEPLLVTAAYADAWGRQPDADEVEAGVRFVRRAEALHRAGKLSASDARAAAVADFCHAVLNTNEFAYID